MPKGKENEKKELLTIKEELFCKHYLTNGFNGTKAAIDAGYSKKSAEVIAHENLRKPKLRKHVQKYLKEVLDTLDDTLDTRIIKTYAARAFYNPLDIIDENGELIEGWKQHSVCIDNIERDLKIDKDGGEHYHVKIRLANRNEALRQLTAYRKLISNTIEIIDKTPLSKIKDGDEAKAAEAYKAAISAINN